MALSLLLFAFLGYWWTTSYGLNPIAVPGIVLWNSETYTFGLDLYADHISMVFFGVTCVLTLLVMVFSKYYMHRDPGFKRFYATLLFFFLGLTCIIFAGTFELLFVGWECIGISSFLLIAFYRDRFLPVRNALKVFMLYRIADALLLFVV